MPSQTPYISLSVHILKTLCKTMLTLLAPPPNNNTLKLVSFCFRLYMEQPPLYCVYGVRVVHEVNKCLWLWHFLWMCGCVCWYSIYMRHTRKTLHAKYVLGKINTKAIDQKSEQTHTHWEALCIIHNKECRASPYANFVYRAP